PASAGAMPNGLGAAVALLSVLALAAPARRLAGQGPPAAPAAGAARIGVDASVYRDDATTSTAPPPYPPFVTPRSPVGVPPGLTGSSADLMLAPFVAPWAQLGGRYRVRHTSYDVGWPGSFTGSARLYLPGAGRTAPFGEGFATFATGSAVRYGRPAGYGAFG